MPAPMHPTDGFGGTPPGRDEIGTPILPHYGQQPHAFFTGPTGAADATPARAPGDEKKFRSALHASPDHEGQVIEELHAEDLFSPSRVDPVVLTAFREGRPLDPSIKRILRQAIRQYAVSDTTTGRGSRKHLLSGVLGAFGEFVVFRDAQVRLIPESHSREQWSRSITYW